MSSITLKWGTLKGWDFEGNDHAIKLLQEYKKIGSSMSVATQEDTPRQKEIICELIDLCDEEPYLDWDGKHVSKAEGKKYVMEYND